MALRKLCTRLIQSAAVAALLCFGLVFTTVPGASSAHAWGGDFYKQTNLVSDVSGWAPTIDPNLVNAWGLVAGPQTPFWIADNGTGVSTLYTPTGAKIPLTVTIPPPTGSTDTSAPTGVVFNQADPGDFIVKNGAAWGPSVFIFATEDGTISGWNPKVNPTSAVLGADNSASGAVYKGLAAGNLHGQDLLFATDFHNGKVDVFNSKFHWFKSFTDPELPANYAPFGIRNIGGWLYVTFAQQNLPEKHDDLAGAGHGFVDVFNLEGDLAQRLISQGNLNSPWGLAVAPSNFGQFSNALLVGNFGNGWINAYDRHSGKFLGSLKDKGGNAIVIDGLWGLSFGNGNKAGPTNTLFFTAGPAGESHGLFGSITNQEK